MSTDDGGDDDAGYVCGAETSTTDDVCQFPVDSPEGRCPAHPEDGSGPPPGHGSGAPGHHKGDGTGAIAEHTDVHGKEGLTHGLHAVQDDPRGTLAWLEDNDPSGHEWILDKWRSYMADAPFEASSSKADDVLHACLMLYAVRSMRHTQVTRGLARSEVLIDDGDVVRGPDGEVVETEREHPGNLPANRVAREARSMLKDLGVLDDPESKKANAMGWSNAAREVALEVDADVVESDAASHDAQGDVDGGGDP
jgi:hypothetical protein